VCPQSSIALLGFSLSSEVAENFSTLVSRKTFLMALIFRYVNRAGVLAFVGYVDTVPARMHWPALKKFLDECRFFGTQAFKQFIAE